MVKLASYKGKGNIVNAAIRGWSGSIYSHCEVVVDGWCYSSSAMDGGVRRKLITLSEDKWDIIDLPWADENKVRDYFYKTSDHTYGWIPLITSQFLNLGKDTEESQFCSMWCANALGIPNASQESPKTLEQLCVWINEVTSESN